MQALQGILAQKNHPEAIWINAGDVYKLWLEDLREEYGVAVEETEDPWVMVERFREHLNGYILYDLGEDSENVATTLAGLFQVLPVTSDLISKAKSRGLQEIIDARDRDEKWVLDNYWPCLNHTVVFHQGEGMHRWLRDYAVATRGLMFYDGDSPFLDEVFSRVEHGGMVMGWGRDDFDGEDQFVGPASRHGLVTVPSDFDLNLSVLSRFKAEGIQQKHRARDLEPKDGAHYVTFIMSDGDNLAWLLGDFATREQWFGSMLRGQFPMGWTISPSMTDLAPTAMKRLYGMATPKDHFISGVSGRGYFYASEFPELEAETPKLNDRLGESDLQLVYISDTNLHGLSSGMLRPYAEQPNIEGGFWTWFGDYSARAGEMVIVDGKPFVSVRYNLWEGFNDADSLATKINALPRDPSSPKGYTLVNVHPWSMSLEDVKGVIDRLSPDVQVVTPGELIALIKENVTYSKRGQLLVAASDAPEEVKARADFLADGIDDDQEIQAAIDALPPWGGKVTLSQGHFTGGQITLRSGLTFEGQGPSTVYKLADTANTNVIAGDGGHDYGNLQDVVIRDLKLHGNRFNQQEPSNVIALREALNVSVTDVLIQDAGNSAILLENTQRAIVSGNRILHGENGITIKDAIFGQNLVQGNALYHLDGNAIQVLAVEETSRDNDISGNVIRETKNGIVVRGTGHAASGNIFSGNRLLFLQEAGFHFGTGGGGNSVANNYVNDVRWGLFTESDAHQLLVSSNRFTFIGRSAIVLGGDHNTVQGNGIDVVSLEEKGAYDAISVAGSKSLIEGNQVTHSVGPDGYRHGIFEGEGADHNRIAGNAIDGAAKGAIHTAGEATFVRNNGGWVTESQGTAVIPGDRRSVTVEHGLSEAPQPGDCTLTPMDDMGMAQKFWIGTLDKEGLVIRLDRSPGGDGASFAWRCELQ